MLRLPVYGLGLWMLRVNSVIRRVFIVSRNRLKGDFSYLMIIKALLFLLKKLVYCDWLRHRVWTVNGIKAFLFWGIYFQPFLLKRLISKFKLIKKRATHGPIFNNWFFGKMRRKFKEGVIICVVRVQNLLFHFEKNFDFNWDRRFSGIEVIGDRK
jgi:hypothetical protein